MTEFEAGPQEPGGWRWYHTLGIVVLSLAGMVTFAAWRIERAVRTVTGGSVSEFFHDPATAMAHGFPVSLEGEAPGTPRRAFISMTSSSSAGATVVRTELRLVDTLPGDSAAAWSGRCLIQSKGMTVRVAIDTSARPAADTVSRTSGLTVMSAGRPLAILPDCRRPTGTGDH